jgi:hypothetical protein
MAIAYLPIDIDVQLPDEKRLLDFCHETKIKSDRNDTDAMEHWWTVPVRSRLRGKEWYDRERLYHGISHRLVEGAGPSYWANDVDKVLPEIPYMFEQLPILEFNFCVMLIQREHVNTHQDTQYADPAVDPRMRRIELEPRRYNILMNKHEIPSFFVCENQYSEKFYPKIKRERSCFSICEEYHWHGADYVVENKIMLCILGVVDEQRHIETIQRSLQKYKDEAIIFPDTI